MMYGIGADFSDCNSGCGASAFAVMMVLPFAIICIIPALVTVKRDKNIDPAEKKILASTSGLALAVWTANATFPWAGVWLYKLVQMMIG